MAGKRKRYSAAFKAKVALEAIRGEATVAELLSKHGNHQTLITPYRTGIRTGIHPAITASQRA